jgi:glutamine synthetase type III
LTLKLEKTAEIGNSTMADSQMRLRYDKVEVLDEGGATCRVRVTVSYAGRVFEAEAAAGGESISYLKAVATATLSATEEAVAHRFTARLADIDHVNALGKELVAVLVDISFENKDVQVFGSCQIAGAEMDAAAKAALNATNRFVELSMRV